MVPQSVAELEQRKQAIREQSHANRKAQQDKDELSRAICLHFAGLAEYAAARTVMVYVDAGSEVRTRHYLPEALRHGKRIVVPYCVEGCLELFHLESTDELEAGRHRILEPKAELRGLARKRVDVSELDLVMVPGVAFDRRGARMGHGWGYYDKLLEQVGPDARLVGLAFECQVFPRIPIEPHDVFMDKVVTERGVYSGLRSRSVGLHPRPDPQSPT